MELCCNGNSLAFLVRADVQKQCIAQCVLRCCDVWHRCMDACCCSVLLLSSLPPAAPPLPAGDVCGACCRCRRGSNQPARPSPSGGSPHAWNLPCECFCPLRCWHAAGGGVVVLKHLLVGSPTCAAASRGCARDALCAQARQPSTSTQHIACESCAMHIPQPQAIPLTPQACTAAHASLEPAPSCL